LTSEDTAWRGKPALRVDDVVGCSIADPLLVFIEEYAGVPAPSVQLACLKQPRETRRGRRQR